MIENTKQIGVLPAFCLRFVCVLSLFYLFLSILHYSLSSLPGARHFHFLIGGCTCGEIVISSEELILLLIYPDCGTYSKKPINLFHSLTACVCRSGPPVCE